MGRKLITFDEYCKIVNTKHNNKYKYIEFIKKNNKNYIKYICNIHGEKIQLINDHKNGAGCKKCGIITRSNKKKTINWKEKLIIQSQLNNANILTDNLDSINRSSNIYFQCFCNEKHIKRVRNLINYGLFCRKCTVYNRTEKSKKTCLEKYGTEYNTQNKEILSKIKKSSYGTKDYIFKTGDIVEIQGYENLALRLLEEQGYNFKDIEIEGIEIKYIYNNKNCIHFPDIYIPIENRIIEVKSTYTYDLELERNIQKQLFSKEQGYIYEFWIFNDKHKLNII